jgi:hypothetical protein
VLALAVLAMLLLGTRAVAMPAAQRKGKRMNLSELRELCRRAGFPEGSLDVAAAVAMAESQGNPNAVNIVTPLQAQTWNDEHPGEVKHAAERSFGLFQVNTIVHPEYDEGRLADPDYNAHAALVLSQGGLNWHPWSTYTHGTYLQWMPGGERYDA